MTMEALIIECYEDHSLPDLVDHRKETHAWLPKSPVFKSRKYVPYLSKLQSNKFECDYNTAYRYDN